MNEVTPSTPEQRSANTSVFISYATADRKQALAVCTAIERRGTQCWISSRDVEPGDNYQEAIVQSIRKSRAMVLVFSEAANNSDEIKKELSLASRYRIPVIALRIEDVEPSDAFAYELSTRQWIDAFEGWDRSIDSIVSRLAHTSGKKSPGTTPAMPARPRNAFLSRRPLWFAASAGLFLLAAAALAWWMLGKPATAAHPMTVRVARFQLLSPDLPSAMGDTIPDEVTAAFNADGVVGVSTAPAAARGSAPAYALGGTIQRDGQTIRVITRLTNERSGTTLWSSGFNYDAGEVARVPRHIAVDAANIVRCGLFGASTYRKRLPDAVLGDYLQFCQGHWDPYLSEGRKALIPAQRVVAALPDFSWGWAAVAGAWWKIAMSADTDRIAEGARESGRQAADRAIAIDSKNSEAWWIKSLLIDHRDWIGRESLLKNAVDARSLDCGCEHHQYGEMLIDVGRIGDAIGELRQANDMLALYVYTPFSLANALVIAGKPDEAKSYFDAAIELAPRWEIAEPFAVRAATDVGEYDVRAKALTDPKLPSSAEVRAALIKGYQAMASRNEGAKTQAVQALVALPEGQQDGSVARLLGDLGADHEAFEVARRIVTAQAGGLRTFWYPSMRRALSDPGFPALAAQSGILNYWKATNTRPDVCTEQAPPAFCRLI